MRIRATWEVKLEENFRETLRRAVAAVPAGASAASHLEREEERGRKLVAEEPASPPRERGVVKQCRERLLMQALFFFFLHDSTNSVRRRMRILMHSFCEGVGFFFLSAIYATPHIVF